MSHRDLSAQPSSQTTTDLLTVGFPGRPEPVLVTHSRERERGDSRKCLAEGLELIFLNTPVPLSMDQQHPIGPKARKLTQGMAHGLALPHCQADEGAGPGASRRAGRSTANRRAAGGSPPVLAVKLAIVCPSSPRSGPPSPCLQDSAPAQAEGPEIAVPQEIACLALIAPRQLQGFPRAPTLVTVQKPWQDAGTKVLEHRPVRCVRAKTLTPKGAHPAH